MQLNSRNVFSALRGVFCLALLVGALPQLQAADASGTWSWTMQRRGGTGGGGEERKITLALKVEGEKLTGKMTSPGRQGGDPRVTEITDGKVKGDEISFTIKREFNGNSMVTKYSGKVTGDTIKGKIAFERGGQTMERDWEAKREAAKK